MPIAKRIFLIGPMGAGKSAVGRQLAQQLYYEFKDTDQEIEKRAGVDVSFIFEKEGEAGFRQRETRMLNELAQQDGLVIATGGGSVVTATNREIMAARGTVIYLEASVEQLLQRVRHSQTRPLLDSDDPRSVLLRLMAERGPLYEALADVTVNTDKRRVRAVADSARRRLDELAFVANVPHANG